MAKEATEEQSQVSQETQNPVQHLTESLQERLRQGAVALSIDGEEKPYELVGGEITNVKVNSAWIAFTHGGCAFRTKELKDREAFWNAATTGYRETQNIRFTKICGTLNRPAETEPVKKQVGFIPRAQHIYGRPKMPVMDRYAFTDE